MDYFVLLKSLPNITQDFFLGSFSLFPSQLLTANTFATNAANVWIRTRGPFEMEVTAVSTIPQPMQFTLKMLSKQRVTGC